ncbi:MAG: hypothetical protein LBE20_07485 [Deltaproteobacteria bacterium]|jgi:Tfp pilus assembly protein PilF|nr:hypothetical protein [Deltaproteobacteria bacterium]
MNKLSPQITKWVIKLIFFFFILSVVAYIFYLNHENAIFYLSTRRQFSAPLALIVLIAFSLGLLLTALIALLLGLHQKLIIWSITRNSKNLQKIKSNYIKARSMLALDNLTAAEAITKKILTQDKKHLLASILLAQIMERQDNISAALEIIEKSCSDENQTNAELLLYFTELNNKAGNYSAAYDKLKILLKTKPNNVRILGLIVETALLLNRVEEAIKYQERLILNSPTKDIQMLEEKLADLKLKVLISDKTLSWKQLKAGLKKLAKKFPENQKISVELEKINS